MSKVMTDKEILEQVIRPYIVREKGLFDGNEVTLDTYLSYDLGMDSVDVVDMVMYLEKRLHIDGLYNIFEKLDYTEAEVFKVGDFINRIKQAQLIAEDRVEKESKKSKIQIEQFLAVMSERVKQR